jgi:hypothetical protein
VFSQYVSPICLPTEEIFGRIPNLGKPVPKAGETCMAVGWGNTEETGLTSDDLREVDVPILETCQNTFDNTTHQVSMISNLAGASLCSPVVS